jgi:hypothetical protein
MNSVGRGGGVAATTILTAVLWSSLGLLGSGCNTPAATASPLKALSSRSNDAALTQAVQKDPFPSAAQSGLASAPHAAP